MRNRRACSRSRPAGALVAVLLIGACSADRAGSPSAGAASPGAGSTGAAAPSADPAGSPGAASASPGSGASSSGSEPAGDALAGEIEAQATGVEPANRAELASLAAELAADWRREAGRDKDTDAIVALLRRELSDKLAAARGGPAGAELEVVRAEVCDRRARALSRRSLALGKAVVDGAIAAAEARGAGEQLRRDVAALMPRIRALRDPDRVRALSRDLQEVSIEASFAITGGGPTSRRLGDYQAQKPGAPHAQ